MNGFEWDENKHLWNLERRRIGFDFIAEYFFSDANAKETTDNRRDYGEARVIRIMKIGDTLYQIVYTLREQKVRIISARRASENEKAIYWDGS